MTDYNLTPHPSFSCAALVFDLELGVVKNAVGDTQRFSPINLKLLAHLLMRQGDVVSRTELFDRVWPNQIVSDDVLTRAISDIRKQLAILDSATQFIETLPKRGYRWMLTVTPVPALEVEDCQLEVFNTVTIHSAAPSFLGLSSLKNALIYVFLAFLLAAAMMWALTQSFNKTAIELAVLPVQADRLAAEPLAKALDDVLLNILRKNDKVSLLSKSAIASRPQNPFPYFFNEFGAKWLLESLVKEGEGLYELELSLVDARTGIEVRSAHFEFSNNIDLSTKLAKKLEVDFFADSLSY